MYEPQGLSAEQLGEFKRVTYACCKWIRENMHPHVHIIVTGIGAELSEGLVACAYQEEEAPPNSGIIVPPSGIITQ